MLKGLIAAVGMSLAVAAPQAAEAAFDKKVALIVGNAAYENAPALANPVTDAKAIAAAFERLGFETVTGYDLDRDGLEDTVRRFARASRKADLTAFFYAGHGIAFDNKNYIIPVDAKFADATALDFEAVGMDFVVKQMRYNDGVSLVFIDACRDNPLASTLTRSLGSATRSAVSRGLAGMDVKNAGRGLAIAFATSPGEVAYDGADNHSPFTKALLNNLETEGADITEVMSRVTGEVLQITDDRQRPWLNASLTGPVVLKPAKAIPVASIEREDGAPADQPSAAAQNKISSLEADTNLFNFAFESKTVAHYEAYLATFPNGLYAAIARQEIERLTGETAKAADVEMAALAPQTETLSDAAAAATAPATAATTGAAEDAAVTDETEETAETAPVDEGTEETEAALALSRTDRREIQTRLNLAKADVGYADGLFGPRTRGGIAKWQEARGLPNTGFLTETQVSTLTEETEEVYVAHVAEQRRLAAARAEREAAARAKRKAKAKATSTRSYKKKATKKTRRAATRTKRRAKRRVVRRDTYRMGRHTYPRYRTNNAGNAAAAAFVGSVVGGIIGGAIGN